MKTDSKKMDGALEESDRVYPVPEQKLPREFKEYDRPLGLKPHVWWSIRLIIVHICAAYCFLYLYPTRQMPWPTFFLAVAWAYVAGLGITVGCHRLWCHKTFKARLPLQIFLMFLQCMSFQDPIFQWSREHRVHHKFTNTDADPNNSLRGFWFAHYGWLVEPRHPKCLEKEKTIDLSDLAADPVVRFQSRHFFKLQIFFSIYLPITLCQWVYPEMSLFQAFVWTMTTHCIALNAFFCVNSVAHVWGDKPYDEHITPTENMWISLATVGEGWHNYHHTFPWDYKAAEFGWRYNLSTVFIDFFAKIGWAHDLKSVSQKMINTRAARTGDGSHHSMHHHNHRHTNIDKTENEKHEDAAEETSCWGWGDSKLDSLKLDFVETTKATKKSLCPCPLKLQKYAH